MARKQKKEPTTHIQVDVDVREELAKLRDNLDLSSLNSVIKHLMNVGKDQLIKKFGVKNEIRKV